MARKKFSCDFETTTDPNDCRVWAYGWMEIGNKKNYKIGNSMDEFMEWCKKVKGDLYFHNLKFDGSFIVNWLMKNGFEHNDSGMEGTFNTIISNMGQWYMIDICYGYKGKRKLHTVIYDSLKKLPFKVERIAKAFKLDVLKGDIDYHTYRPVGHEITDEEYAYIKNDIEIIADALQIQFSQGLDRMTSGSDSLNGYKGSVTNNVFDKLFPVFSRELDSELRMAYRGGFTWLNDKYAGKDLGKGIVFDVNSLYPAQMYTRELPYGMPIPFEGKYEWDSEYPLFIKHIRCEFVLKENRIPCIQVKGDLRFKATEYLKSSNGEMVDLYVTNVDLEMIMEHYHLYDLEYLEGWKFRSKKGMFKQFIDKWTYVKTHETGAKRELAKLMLNSLYGKFASNPKVTGKIPYLKEDGSNGFTLPRDENGEVIDDFKDPVYTPMGVFITSWARHVCIGTAQKCYDRVIYCDTDSLHLVGTSVPDEIKDIIDDKKMGYWDWETTYQKARYLRQKTYLMVVDGKLIVKCAGMPSNVKEQVTWDNFHVGLKLDGKLLPKQVNGGVVLIENEFTIK